MTFDLPTMMDRLLKPIRERTYVYGRGGSGIDTSKVTSPVKVGLPPPTPTPVPTITPRPTMTPQQELSGYNRPAPEESILSLILQAASQYNVDPNILAAMLMQESRFDPNVVAGPPGSQDIGIAQINERWHPDVSRQQALDPNFAIPWMAQNVGTNTDYYGGDLNRAIQAYNVGRGGVENNGPAAQFYLDNVVRNLTDELIAQLGLRPSE